MSMFDSLTRSLIRPAEEPQGDDKEQTKGQLLQRIQHLLEQNERYELRFRDVVGAYRATLKEKEALEQSIAALTSSTGDDPEQEEATTGGDGESGDDKDKESDAPQSPSSNENTENNNKARTSQLQAKVKTLAKSLRTLSQEKQALESRFQADKKKVADAHRAALKQQQDETDAKIERLEERAVEAESELERLKQTIQQQTESLRAGHQAEKTRIAEWDKERRKLREELEASRTKATAGNTSTRVQELEEELRQARDAEVEALTQLSTGSNELKEKIADLEERLAKATKDLMSAESRGEGAEILRLKQELRVAQNAAAKYKAQADVASKKHVETAREAQKQMDAAEEKISTFLIAQKEKEAGRTDAMLAQENRLSELSTLVGRYEAAKSLDVQAIDALREENAELIQQIKELQQERQDHSSDKSYVANDKRHQELEDKVERLQSLLHLANQRIADTYHTEGALSVKVPQPPWSGLSQSEGIVALDEARSYADRLYHLASELALSRSECMKVAQSEKEKSQNLSSELMTLKTEFDERLQQERRAFENKLSETEERFNLLNDQKIQEHGLEVQKLIDRNQKARERSLDLLNERDTEIQRLREQLGLRPDPNLQDPSTSMNGRASRKSRPSSPSQFDGLEAGGPLVHSILEERDRGKSMNLLRHRLRDLEEAMNDSNYREQLLKEQAEGLKQEIRRLDANAKREGANLEYLKNILIKYLTNQTGRDQAIVAIATILQFTKEEVTQVNSVKVGWFR
eukprot:m.13393 g.13393  ORF g.13393 m.13393 type:complete len:752 (-) comp4845_c0_seq1:50-2305(-)